MRSRKTIATPPGATIKEQLEDRGMSQKEFALRMALSEKHISRLINGDVHLTPDVAHRLEYVLGIPAQFWNNLEAIYQEKLIQVEEENALDADEELARKFPYKEMSDFGWVAVTHSIVEKVKNLRAYFEVARLESLEKLRIPGIAYRRTDAQAANNYALAAWSQRARIEAREHEVGNINIDKLEKSIPEIRKMTKQDPKEFFAKLESLLADCGIALVVLPHMKSSFLHGATFYDGKKIVMGLTVRGHDADRFWFSLFHEIGHVLNGHTNKPDGPDDADEAVADKFSAETLIPMSAFKEYLAENEVDDASIRAFAMKIDIDEGIDVGRLQKDRIIGFNMFNQLKTHYVLE